MTRTPGRVLPGNSRARNRSRSRCKNVWKAPSKLAYLRMLITDSINDRIAMENKS